MKPGDLVRIVDNDQFTFHIHANKPGIYLGTGNAMSMHCVLLNTGKTYFAIIEGSFEQVEQS